MNWLRRLFGLRYKTRVKAGSHYTYGRSEYFVNYKGKKQWHSNSGYIWYSLD